MHRMWCSALIVWSSQHGAEERLWGRGEASCRETVRKRRGWTKEWRGDSVSENVTLSSELRVVPHGCSEQIVRIIIPSVCVCVHPAGQNVNRIIRLQVQECIHTHAHIIHVLLFICGPTTWYCSCVCVCQVHISFLQRGNSCRHPERSVAAVLN